MMMIKCDVQVRTDMCDADVSRETPRLYMHTFECAPDIFTFLYFGSTIENIMFMIWLHYIHICLRFIKKNK